MKIRNNNPMKPHSKPPANHLQTSWHKATSLPILSIVLIASLLVGVSSASVPLAWTVTPRNPAPVAFDRHHGETLDFRCQFEGFGELPFAQAADIRLWYQTNGMAAAWWSVPASVSSNVLSATFPPQADPSADRLALFFGAPSNAYASAVLRLRHSPGFTPNVLPAPESGYTETDPVFSAWLAINDLASAGLTANDVCNIVTNVANDWTGELGTLTKRSDNFWRGPLMGVYGDGYMVELYYTSSQWQIIDDASGLDLVVSISGAADDRRLIFNLAEGSTAATTLGTNKIELVREGLLTDYVRHRDLPDAAARAVYDVHDLMWDESESILYWHKIRQGHDEYIAVTNINLTDPTYSAALRAWREANP